MIALTFLMIIFLWLSASTLISYKIGKLIINTKKRIVFTIIIFVVIFPAPMIDEIIGSRQFEKLCLAEINRAQHSKIIQKDSVHEEHGEYLERKGFIMPITEKTISFYSKNDMLLESYSAYKTQGGWISRNLLGGWGPWIGRGECMPKLQIK